MLSRRPDRDQGWSLIAGDVKIIIIKNKSKENHSRYRSVRTRSHSITRSAMVIRPKITKRCLASNCDAQIEMQVNRALLLLCSRWLPRSRRANTGHHHQPPHLYGGCNRKHLCPDYTVAASAATP